MEFSLQAKFLCSSHTLAMWLIIDARNKFISPSLGRNEVLREIFSGTRVVKRTRILPNLSDICFLNP